MVAVAEAGVVVLRTSDETDVSLRRISVDEYHRMIKTRILREEDRVELLEGLLVVKSPQNPEHAEGVLLAWGALQRHVQPGDRVRMQFPVTLDDSEPEPDVAVVTAGARHFHGRHPGKYDVLMVLQVSRTSLRHDRAQKGRVFARTAIPFYWIVNLVDRQVEVYSEPVSGPKDAGYSQRVDYVAGDAVPLIFAGEPIGSIPVVDLLP